MSRVEVAFTCKRCGVADERVSGRAREDQESLASWMTTVQRTVGFRHAALSPRCRSGRVDLKIPVSPGEASRVGS